MLDFKKTLMALLFMSMIIFFMGAIATENILYLIGSISSVIALLEIHKL